MSAAEGDCGPTGGLVWAVGGGEGLSSKPGSFFLRYSRPWSNIFNCSQRSNLTPSGHSGSDKNIVYLLNIIVNNYFYVFISTIMLLETQDIGSWLLAVGFRVKEKATAKTKKDTKPQGMGYRKQGTGRSKANGQE